MPLPFALLLDSASILVAKVGRGNLDLVHERSEFQSRPGDK